VSLLAIKTRLYERGQKTETEQLAASISRTSGPWVKTLAASALARAGLMGAARSIAEETNNAWSTPLSQYAAERARGEILLMEGRGAAGLAHLEKAAAALPPAWPREFLGWGLEKAGRPEAAAEYRRVVAAKGILWVSVYLERPGIWADTLERLISLDPGAAGSMKAVLNQIRKKGE
jgi:hypothetical protein